MEQALRQVKEILEQTHTGEAYSRQYIAERMLSAVLIIDAALALTVHN